MAIVDVHLDHDIYTGWKYADGLVSVIVMIETAECDLYTGYGLCKRLVIKKPMILCLEKNNMDMFCLGCEC